MERSIQTQFKILIFILPYLVSILSLIDMSVIVGLLVEVIMIITLVLRRLILSTEASDEITVTSVCLALPLLIAVSFTFSTEYNTLTFYSMFRTLIDKIMLFDNIAIAITTIKSLLHKCQCVIEQSSITGRF